MFALTFGCDVVGRSVRSVSSNGLSSCNASMMSWSGSLPVSSSVIHVFRGAVLAIFCGVVTPLTPSCSWCFNPGTGVTRDAGSAVLGDGGGSTVLGDGGGSLVGCSTTSGFGSAAHVCAVGCWGVCCMVHVWVVGWRRVVSGGTVPHPPLFVNCVCRCG